MLTVTLQEAQSKLAELVRGLSPGQELLITEDDRPVARLIPTPPEPPAPPRKERKLGTLRGTVLSMEHFDDPLEEFEEYM